jgi:glutamyl-tRNA reductase
MRWQESLAATSMIKAYREHVIGLHDEALVASLKLLRQGEDPEIVLTMLARRLSRAFMHKPSVNLKKAGYDGRFDLIELTQQLFDIK